MGKLYCMTVRTMTINLQPNLSSTYSKPEFLFLLSKFAPPHLQPSLSKLCFL